MVMGVREFAGRSGKWPYVVIVCGGVLAWNTRNVLYFAGVCGGKPILMERFILNLRIRNGWIIIWSTDRVSGNYDAE